MARIELRREGPCLFLIVLLRLHKVPIFRIVDGLVGVDGADRELFPCLALAEAAMRAGGLAPTILNGANEEAVAAFLAGRIGFL